MTNRIARFRRGADGRPGPVGALAIFGFAALLIVPAAPAMSGAETQRPAAPDLSAPLSFANGQCRFSPAIDRAIADMLYWDEGRQRFATRAVRLANMSLTPSLSVGPPEGGGRLYRSAVRLTRPARWNGLTLTGLGAAAGYEYRQREIRFAEPAAAVRRRLRALGTDLPAPPAYRRIPTDGCAASIGIEVRGQGSALVCTGWC
jgi:hypothetical protein